MMDSLKLVTVSRVAQRIFPKAFWQIDTRQKVIYLTFDDGPIPQVTTAVLDLLKQYNALATFFCIGKNIVAHPETFQRILREGHRVGNHTQDHLNGWKTSNDVYFNNTALCQQQLVANNAHTTLFRPPYGKLSFSQYNFLKQQHKIVMWTVLSKDYDPDVPKETVLLNVLRHARAGSIIVFHDSAKAKENVLYALPIVLETFSKQGFIFACLPM